MLLVTHVFDKSKRTINKWIWISKYIQRIQRLAYHWRGDNVVQQTLCLMPFNGWNAACLKKQIMKAGRPPGKKEWKLETTKEIWRLRFRKTRRGFNTNVQMQVNTVACLKRWINNWDVRVDKYLDKWALTNGWTQRKGTSTHTPPHYNIVNPHLFIHLPSTHQLNLFPLARSCTILAPCLPSLSLSEFLFNLQEMFPLMGLLIWCCASCFYLQELKEVLGRRDALFARFNRADSGL